MAAAAPAGLLLLAGRQTGARWAAACIKMQRQPAAGDALFCSLLLCVRHHAAAECAGARFHAATPCTNPHKCVCASQTLQVVQKRGRGGFMAFLLGDKSDSDSGDDMERGGRRSGAGKGGRGRGWMQEEEEEEDTDSGEIVRGGGGRGGRGGGTPPGGSARKGRPSMDMRTPGRSSKVRDSHDGPPLKGERIAATSMFFQPTADAPKGSGRRNSIEGASGSAPRGRVRRKSVDFNMPSSGRR